MELSAHGPALCQLCAEAGGVDAFLIGSELRGLTRSRARRGRTIPSSRRWRARRRVRAILPDAKISYAADWSEYRPSPAEDGSGDVTFISIRCGRRPTIDFVGIDNYMPLADWRDGDDASRPPRPARARSTIRDYLAANIAGGEGYDWYYASEPTATRKRARRSPTALRQALGLPLQGSERLVGERASDRAGGVEAAADGLGAAVEADLVHRDSAARRSTRAPTSPTSSRPEIVGKRLALLFLGRARRSHPAPLPRGGAARTGAPIAAPIRCRLSMAARWSIRRASHLWAWDARPIPPFPALTTSGRTAPTCGSVIG